MMHVEPPPLVLGPPMAEPIVLEHRPQVLSWDKAGSPEQARLVPYREEIASRFASVDSDGLSFRLDCGLGPTSDLELAGDLDNLLVPVIDALGHSRFVAAWGTKDGGRTSRLAVGPPSTIEPSTLASWSHAHARTTTSAGTSAWKEQVAAQIPTSAPLPSVGAAALVVAFRVGPGRAWHNLWKPTIDTLGAVLGLTGTRRWHPRDGRITDLGLCVGVVDGLGWDVVIDFWWEPRGW